MCDVINGHCVNTCDATGRSGGKVDNSIQKERLFDYFNHVRPALFRCGAGHLSPQSTMYGRSGSERQCDVNAPAWPKIDGNQGWNNLVARTSGETRIRGLGVG